MWEYESYFGSLMKATMSKEICLFAIKIWTVLSLTCGQPKLFPFYPSENNFSTGSIHISKIIFFKIFCNFPLKLNMANRRQLFSAFWVLKHANQISERSNFALICSSAAIGRKKIT